MIIHSTNDPTAINKNYKTDHAVLGDARLVLQALIAEIEAQTGGVGRKNDRDAAPEVAALKREWLDEWMPQLTSDEVPINQYRIIWDLLHNVDRANTIVTHDAGSPREQIVPFWETVAPHTYMGWGKSTQLGYGLGITMGAKLAEPDKLCVNMMGDAAIGMVGIDIETAVRNKIGILTIVFNNQVMAIERGHMPYSAETYDSLTQYGDYEKLADALGAWAMKVEKPDDFVPALRRAVAVTRTGRPRIVGTASSRKGTTSPSSHDAGQGGYRLEIPHLTLRFPPTRPMWRWGAAPTPPARSCAALHTPREIPPELVPSFQKVFGH